MSAPGQASDTAILDLLARDSDPRRAFAAGDLVRVRRGCYYPTDVWLALTDAERFRLAVAAHAWTHPDAVFCGETALFLRGIPVVKVPPTIDVATSSTTRLGIRPSSFAVRGATERSVRALGSAPPPLRRHFHATAMPQEVPGYLTVPIVEALVETMVHAKFARALTVADGVLRLDAEAPLLDRAPVLGAITALRYATHRRRCEAVASLARAGAESPGESVSRALMLRFGFPEPVLQREYADAQGLIGRTDFAWPPGTGAAPTPSGKERVGEFDGWGKYFDSELNGGESPVAVIKREKKRENRLLALGHPVLRWTWAELEQPARFRSMLVASGLPPSRSAAFAL
ncbi:hypothetical protein SA2016_3012 [Sinomonas atrocyanea]|uniref:Transcriptional regulator, AbiEi antitoxin, Type IV TA system n=1 Tax=Sinomonas atrocyanea TaxID=37927 RepID=A0A127A3B3_9MICC|nr:hypothetical protein [Sinomonas atrocyanea]AMM33677.1 hypothetical protein SA2016_3012 [Sinomonas atrocyanea]GEB63346.1 CTP synthase [Sinomonas atrocyanea]GGG53503.1 CTP synthase [Sinomonas atrocyanea]